MRILLLIAAVIGLSAQAWAQEARYARSETNAAVLLPDARVTPGMIRTTDANEICAASFRTKPFRKTTGKMKVSVYRAYGVEPRKGTCRGGCEVDHLVPLELGGLDDVRNLWPQPSAPKPGFHEKDVLENWLHRQVCREKSMSLEEAQRALMLDWYDEFTRMVAPRPILIENTPAKIQRAR